MKITTFKTEKYRDCPIYFRNFGNHFEYLTIIQGQLYTTHISVRPYWVTRILCAFDFKAGFNKLPYSETHLKNILTQVKAMAEATIDYVLDKE